jgi:hypothetical protein
MCPDYAAERPRAEVNLQLRPIVSANTASLNDDSEAKYNSCAPTAVS